MSRKTKYIDLTESERVTLREGSKYHPKSEFREKCQGLLLNHSGLPIKQIATHLGVNHNSVGSWIKAWEKIGIVGLNCKTGQGRRPILSVSNSTQAGILDKAVEKHSQNVKAIQAELIQALDKPLSIDTVKRFLKKTVILGAASAGVATKGKTKRSMPTSTSGGKC